jgi:cytochrome c peroxidase
MRATYLIGASLALAAGAALAQGTGGTAEAPEFGDMEALVPGELYPNTEAHGARRDRIVPLGPLGDVPVPADNPMTEAKVELGRMLFFDPRLSGNATMPCSACHLPDVGWGTPDAISLGYPGTTHWRNSQTILNSAHYNKYFWDGAKTSLETQAPAAAHGAVAGNGDDSIMEMRLAFVPEYRERFREVFGTDYPIVGDAWRAIAAFQRTIVSDPERVPFDRFTAGDEDALSPEARRGLDLFRGEAGCIACHDGPLLSDQSFHALGVPQDVILDTDDPLQMITVRWENYAKGVPREVYYADPGDLGLYYVTKRPADRYKFRVPSLRELVHTAPYMHNGALATLAEVVDFYDAGGGETENKSPLIRPLGLSDEDKAALVAFLESLSMDEPLLMEAPALPEIEPWRQGR